MSYSLEVKFDELHEAVASLHTMICKKSHKKIDVGGDWAAKARKNLTPSFLALLDTMSVDQDWKNTYLLMYLSEANTVEAFTAWLEGQKPGDLYEAMSPYTSQFPEQMAEYRARIVAVVSGWQEQYVRHVDPQILIELKNHAQSQQEQLKEPQCSAIEFVDRTTNGILFEPAEGFQKLVLIPQYHFQPMNMIYSFQQFTLVHYASRVYPGQEEDISPQDYRLLRSLAEKSRLKILKFLHKGPRTFIEIVRHLNLSKGITHDHISKLRSAGLIYAHFEGESVLCYSLRSKGITHVERSVIRYIEM